jgi:hypothetical protein
LVLVVLLVLAVVVMMVLTVVTAVVVVAAVAALHSLSLLVPLPSRPLELPTTAMKVATWVQTLASKAACSSSSCCTLGEQLVRRLPSTVCVPHGSRPPRSNAER